MDWVKAHKQKLNEFAVLLVNDVVDHKGGILPVLGGVALPLKDVLQLGVLLSVG